MPQNQTPNEENKDTPTKKLTNRDRLFLDRYFELGMNGTRAWMSTHPKCGYDSARASAAEFLAKDNVKAEISKRMESSAMPANEVLARLADMARGSHRPFIRVSDDGFVYFDFSDPEAQKNLHLIKKIKTKRERRIEGKGEEAEEWEGEWVEVELHDAQSALVTLAKYHRLLTESIDLNAQGGITLTVKYQDKKPDES